MMKVNTSPKGRFKGKRLQVKSRRTCVLTGMSSCGLIAWQVKIAFRSSLLTLGSLKTLVVSLPMTSKVSSISAWSLHHVKAGGGSPETTEFLGQKHRPLCA